MPNHLLPLRNLFSRIFCHLFPSLPQIPYLANTSFRPGVPNVIHSKLPVFGAHQISRQMRLLPKRTSDWPLKIWLVVQIKITLSQWLLLLYALTCFQNIFNYPSPLHLGRPPMCMDLPPVSAILWLCPPPYVKIPVIHKHKKFGDHCLRHSKVYCRAANQHFNVSSPKRVANLQVGNINIGNLQQDQ